MAMATTTKTTSGQIRECVRGFDLKRLFIDVLSWDNFRVAPLTISVGEQSYVLRPVAQKRDVAVYKYEPARGEGIPDYATRKKIDSQVTKLAHEHLIVYMDAGHAMQIWQWVRRQPGKPAAYREQRHYAGQSGEALAQRLQQLYVDLLEEESLTLTDVVSRLQQGFDVDKVTKRFYERFKVEHSAFLDAIAGIAEQDQREWYASLMLNRLMFTYFIQEKGFLNGDLKYLRNKLREVQQRFGPNQFDTFYREFLLHFFHDGLGKPEGSRSPDIRALIGSIPYLNGGLFEVHTIEAANRQITIPDAAFERVFAFFEGYTWTLDDRPMRDDKEINPDVLGYIFEKYINQKQMGAYYTKEDITGYIGKNTILPFMLEATRADCLVAFDPDGEVWRLLRDDPDRYIYDAVRKGIDLELPPEIAAGIADVSKRGGWNRPADSDYALPTETWREHVARRTRCLDLRAKLARGEIHDVNDLITYNLDIQRFTQDVIEHCEGPELLLAFWKALTSVTILDPTCGSGAFLFAALRILEPLYTACLERMHAFEQGFANARKPLQPAHVFVKTLREAERHPRREYYIRKSIIINNLYGVDIMEEAVEIAKLRLFLTLVSQVDEVRNLEPLPDIDFNIKAGNTLVGFTTLDAVRHAMMYGPNGQMRMHSTEDDAILARINQRAQEAGRAYQHFQQLQSELGIDAEALRSAKAALRQQLGDLRGELDRYLAREYGISAHEDLFAFEPWRKSHQPFHWFIEFYSIVQTHGGFDVIIGNPPYVEYETVADKYRVIQYETQSCGNLYAMVCERSKGLSRREGWFGMIVPASATSTDGYSPFQKMLLGVGSVHVSSFSDQRGKLFDIPHPRLCIILYKNALGPARVFTTEYNKLGNSELRELLFPRLTYQEVSEHCTLGRFPRLGTPLEVSVYGKIHKKARSLGAATVQHGGAQVYYTRKLSWFVQVTRFVPQILDAKGKVRQPSELKTLQFSDDRLAGRAFGSLNSNLFYWFVTVGSDCRNLNKREVQGLPVSLDTIAQPLADKLDECAQALDHSIAATSEVRAMSFPSGDLRIQCLYPGKSKNLMNEIDGVLAQHYGFTDEELDFIINYDIKYRVGAESDDVSNEEE